MDPRRGEKFGWIGGWGGGFVWLVILGVLWFVQGRALSGAAALGLAALGCLVIFDRRPWRHPDTPLWQLMIPIYVVFIGAFVLFVVLQGGLANMGLSPWSGFLVLPILLPFWTAGRRRWRDGEPDRVPEDVPENAPEGDR